MNTILNKEIAIIGGGPGGLTLARLLQMQGAEVKVYERDAHKDARPKGATLDLHDESGLKALRAAGLIDAFYTNYRPGADRMRLTDKNGNILLDEDIDHGDEHARPEIDRGPLQQLLLDSLKPGTVVWNSHFVVMTQRNGVWKLEFANGEVAFADMVIAADGANSKLRKYITPIKPFYAGVTAIEGAVQNSKLTVPKMHRLLNGGKIFAFGDERSLIVSSKGDGSLVFYPGFKADENWVKDCGINFKDRTQVTAWFKTEFAGWDKVWDELFENSDYFIARPQYCMPLDQTWDAQPNLTMIGDSAHLMPPYAGEGVNMAMLDALELSEHLLKDDHENTHQAIAAFEDQMRTRMAEMGRITMESTAALHSANAISFLMDVVS